MLKFGDRIGHGGVGRGLGGGGRHGRRQGGRHCGQHGGRQGGQHGGRHGGSELVAVLTMVQVEVAAEAMDVIEVVADTQVH